MDPPRLYDQLCVSTELSSQAASSQVFSPLQSLTAVFGMGTGGPSAFMALTAAPSGIQPCDAIAYLLIKMAVALEAVSLSAVRIWCTFRDSTLRCNRVPTD